MERSWTTGIAMVAITALAVRGDYARLWFEDNYSSNFNITPGVFFVLAANLILVGLMVRVVRGVIGTPHPATPQRSRDRRARGPA